MFLRYHNWQELYTGQNCVILLLQSLIYNQDQVVKKETLTLGQNADSGVLRLPTRCLCFAWTKTRCLHGYMPLVAIALLKVQCMLPPLSCTTDSEYRKFAIHRQYLIPTAPKFKWTATTDWLGARWQQVDYHNTVQQTGSRNYPELQASEGSSLCNFRVRLIHQRKISFSLSLSHLAKGRSKFSPLLICGSH